MIKASEITDYVYCRRAWWLQRHENITSHHIREMTAGTHYHQKHGRVVQQATWTRRLAYTLIFLVIFFVTFSLLMGA